MTTRNGVEADIERARAATRELHEAIQEAKDARRALLAAAQEVRAQLDDVLEREVTRQLGALAKATGDAIEAATAAVFARFDKLTAILLGETSEGRRKMNGMSVPEAIEHRAEILAEMQNRGNIPPEEVQP